MHQRTVADSGLSLTELLGTYSQLSARFAPPTYPVSTVAQAVNDWDKQQTSTRAFGNKVAAPQGEDADEVEA